MGTTNYGTQTITFRYNQPLIASDIGKLLYNITKPGIYDGGNLTINSGNNVNIAPLDVLVETSALQMMHIKTADTIVFPITESTPYITCQFTWIDSTTNYMDFTAKAVGDLLTSDVIVGMGVYVASTLTSFDYTSKTWGTFDRSGNIRSATDVLVKGANNLYNSTKTLTSYGNTTIYKQATYVGLDNDGYGRIEFDTTAGAVTYTLPLMANNIGRRIEIALVKNDASNDVVTISPHAADANKLSNDLLASIILAKTGNFIVVQQSSNSDCWEIVSEQITSQLKLDTYAGYGSTDTKIIRFTTVTENIGNMFSENHGSGYSGNAKGLEITINRSGVYSFGLSVQSAIDTAAGIGFSRDSNQLTTNILTITRSTALTHTYTVPSGGSTDILNTSITVYLRKNSVIRSHTVASPVPATASYCLFSCTYLGQ